MVDFGPPTKEHTIIKVIGVGGGGGNAVNHMYRQGIHDVSFVLCNTDNQALNDSPVPVRLQLGKEGLGAGNKPEKARQAAEESLDNIKKMLSDGTKMAFITAGMGGGTGTGAAPVIARVSKELGILTVGIVTIPFRFEGARKIDQALDGVEEMSKHVDALLVINNERLRDIYPELPMLEAFGKAVVWGADAGIATQASGLSPAYRTTVTRSIRSAREELVPIDLLGKLPNGEFFAALSGGRIYKGRMPILLSDRRERMLLTERGELRPDRVFRIRKEEGAS